MGDGSRLVTALGMERENTSSCFHSEDILCTELQHGRILGVYGFKSLQTLPNASVL